MKCVFAGDITQKGYEKKRSRLLAPYVPKQTPGKCRGGSSKAGFAVAALNSGQASPGPRNSTHACPPPAPPTAPRFSP